MLNAKQKTSITSEIRRGCKEHVGSDAVTVEFPDASSVRVKATTSVGAVEVNVKYDPAVLAAAAESSATAQFIRDNSAAVLARAILKKAMS
jgi:hypothetical protein